MDLDPGTPVIVGVGQAVERIDDPDYQGMSAVELAAAAAQAALEDCAADVAAAIDTVAGVRQFEISGPVPKAPLGRSNNYPRSVAQRIGADPARAILEIVGGQGPQHLITELAGAIAAGSSEVAMVFGSDATSTSRHFAGRADKPDFTEIVDGELQDRGPGIDGLITRYTIIHGLVDAPTQYGLLENARRAATGLGPADYLRRMGELFAPFTKIAAGNPFAAAPIERTVEELITVTDRNRMIAEPYPRLLVARDQVNQGAAALVMSVAAARRLGVPEEKVGLPSRACRPARAGPAAAPRSWARPVSRAGGARGAPGGRCRCRRHRHLRPVQLLSGAGVQHLRRSGDCDR
ncbi:Acetyl-CoA acetyltransferase [Mycobacterium sp. 012931]|nr:Acetyl-CoA acetyltransferase [Mycobacterium sp. 012931]